MDDLSGRVIKGYELRERAGVGGFGVVYRAYQSIVEREVAIKIILPNYANHPDFVRSFEVEAQLVARLEHPHIVPLYDYWREPDGAYLVMRWLRGGSLRTALNAGPWEIEAAVRLIDQIAEALMVAHRQGVVHRDIKPDNILLDEDRNAYLSDFGIAKDLVGKRDAVKDGTLVGSPPYLSPEQILRAQVTAQSDIYSLGIVLYELLTGATPFSDPSVTKLLSQHINDPMPSVHAHRKDLPIAFNAVIWRATAKDPQARYPDALSFAAEFREAALQSRKTSRLPTSDLAAPGDSAATSGSIVTVPLGPAPTPPGPATAPPDGIPTGRVTALYGRPPTPTGPAAARLEVGTLPPLNPYKGLRAFEEVDASDFFGREALVEALLKRLGESGSCARFLAVVGPSGSGKSSVVRAGLVPALRRGALRGSNAGHSSHSSSSDQWFSVVMLPGAHPLDELALALLRVALDAPPDLLDRLRADERGLLWAMEQILPGDDSELVLVIDQFEELFTLVEDETERAHFLKILSNAVTEPDSRLRVVITLRADFYDRPLLYPGFGDLVRQGTEVVLPLSPGELERAIVGPAQRTGLALEISLIAEIVADVSEQPGALPLLQYTLTEIFERRDGRMLTERAYREIGGVSGALARRADELFQALDAERQRAARQLFLRMVSLGEGAETTRRRVLWAELLAISPDKQIIQQVIDTFGQYRLLTFDREPTTRMPTVEVAHEALIREWGQFKEWIETSRDELRVQRRLATATAEWLNARRDSSFLATGARLEQFETLASRSDLALSEQEMDYLRASIALRQRSRNRLRLFIATLALFSLAALALAALAFDRQNRALIERDRADLQGRIARSRELSVTALTNLGQPDRALLLSLEALQSADTFEARSSLLTALEFSPRLKAFLHGHTDAVRSIAYSPDGRVLASGGRDMTIRMWDAETRQPIGQPLARHSGPVNSAAFSPDGRLLASGSGDATIRLWDAATGEPVGEPLAGHADAVWSVAFSPDGKLLASGSGDATIRLWDAATGDLIGQPLAGHEDSIYSVAFSPDGKLLASGSGDATIRLWDAATGDLIGQPLAGHANWVMALAFSPDGRALVSSGADSTIIVWDLTTGRPLRRFDSGHSGWVRSLAFSPDGRLLASGSADGSVRLWDAASGALIGEPLAAHRDEVWSVAFSPKGNLLASGGKDGAVILWNPERNELALNVLRGHAEPVSGVAFSPDGKLLASAGGDPSGAGSLRLWDAASGTEVAALSGHRGAVTGAAFSRDGKLLASTGDDWTVILWDMATREPTSLTGHENVVWSAVFSPDGRTVASASDDGSIMLWDVASGQPLGQPLTGHTGGVRTLAFSPDGKLLASGGRDASVILWDAAARQAVSEPLRGHSDVVMSVAFSPNGKLLASGSRDGTIMLWDVETRQPIRQPLTGHADYVTSVAFSPDGKRLVSGSNDRTFILWDVATGRALGKPFVGHTDWVNSVAFSPDGRLLASGSNDRTIMLWDVSLESWRQRACAVANRDFSPDEWAFYLSDLPYERTCSGARTGEANAAS